jgi:sugar phosphate isomerase/epimerase
VEILFAKSKWEVWEQPTELFLKKVKDDGYDATEYYINEDKDEPEELVELHEKYGLKIIAQFLTEGENFSEHLESVDRLATKALKCKPIMVNCHPGKDFFSLEENYEILKRICELSKETGIPFLAETHRGRATYSLIETVKYLVALPELRLTADISHWMVVHESDLNNQKENLDFAIERSRHIHARVGYEEGPQVPDPRAPEWKGHLENHLKIWQKIVDKCKKAGNKILTVTPEFGPPKYLHTLPYSNKPVADAWELNLAIKRIFEKKILDEI